VSTKHSKRRDSGIMYELLVRAVSQALVEGDEKGSKKALRILKKVFASGTELQRELRLIMSLMQTTVTNQSVATSILQEAKLAARMHDVTKLDREKSILIREVNHGLNDPGFYDQPIRSYRMLATIQTLINDWRTPEPDLKRAAEYEDKLVEWLTTAKEDASDVGMSDLTRGEQRLLVRSMSKRLDEKWRGKLNEAQTNIIRAKAQDDGTLEGTLKGIQKSLVEGIQAYKTTHAEAYETQKLGDVEKQLVAENLDALDDAMVSRFMLYAKLDEELKQED